MAALPVRPEGPKVPFAWACGPCLGVRRLVHHLYMACAPAATRSEAVSHAVPRLSIERCYSLLRSALAGHLALSQGALPLVLPVTCLVEGQDLLVRAGLGHLAQSHLAPAYVEPGIVAFQTAANSLDQSWRWEVLVRGHGVVLEPSLSPDRSPSPLPLVADELTAVLRINMELVTGWQYGTSPSK